MNQTPSDQKNPSSQMDLTEDQKLETSLTLHPIEEKTRSNVVHTKKSIKIFREVVVKDTFLSNYAKIAILHAKQNNVEKMNRYLDLEFNTKEKNLRMFSAFAIAFLASITSPELQTQYQYLFLKQLLMRYSPNKNAQQLLKFYLINNKFALNEKEYPVRINSTAGIDWNERVIRRRTKYSSIYDAINKNNIKAIQVEIQRLETLDKASQLSSNDAAILAVCYFYMGHFSRNPAEEKLEFYKSSQLVIVRNNLPKNWAIQIDCQIINDYSQRKYFDEALCHIIPIVNHLPEIELAKYLRTLPDEEYSVYSRLFMSISLKTITQQYIDQAYQLVPSANKIKKVEPFFQIVPDKKTQKKEQDNAYLDEFLTPEVIEDSDSENKKDHSFDECKYLKVNPIPYFHDEPVIIPAMPTFSWDEKELWVPPGHRDRFNEVVRLLKNNYGNTTESVAQAQALLKAEINTVLAKRVVTAEDLTYLPHLSTYLIYLCMSTMGFYEKLGYTDHAYFIFLADTTLKNQFYAATPPGHISNGLSLLNIAEKYFHAGFRIKSIQLLKKFQNDFAREGSQFVNYYLSMFKPESLLASRKTNLFPDLYLTKIGDTVKMPDVEWVDERKITPTFRDRVYKSQTLIKVDSTSDRPLNDSLLQSIRDDVKMLSLKTQELEQQLKLVLLDDNNEMNLLDSEFKESESLSMDLDLEVNDSKMEFNHDSKSQQDENLDLLNHLPSSANIHSTGNSTLFDCLSSITFSFKMGPLFKNSPNQIKDLRNHILKLIEAERLPLSADLLLTLSTKVPDIIKELDTILSKIRDKKTLEENKIDLNYQTIKNKLSKLNFEEPNPNTLSNKEYRQGLLGKLVDCLHILPKEEELNTLITSLTSSIPRLQRELDQLLYYVKTIKGQECLEVQLNKATVLTMLHKIILEQQNFTALMKYNIQSELDLLSVPMAKSSYLSTNVDADIALLFKLWDVITQQKMEAFNDVAVRRVKALLLRHQFKFTLDKICFFLRNKLEQLLIMPRFDSTVINAFAKMDASLQRIKHINHASIPRYCLQFLLLQLRFSQQRNDFDFEIILSKFIQDFAVIVKNNHVANKEFYLSVEKHIDDIIYHKLMMLHKHYDHENFAKLFKTYTILLENIGSPTSCSRRMVIFAQLHVFFKNNFGRIVRSLRNEVDLNDFKKRAMHFISAEPGKWLFSRLEKDVLRNILLKEKDHFLGKSYVDKTLFRLANQYYYNDLLSEAPIHVSAIDFVKFQHNLFRDEVTQDAITKLCSLLATADLSIPITRLMVHGFIHDKLATASISDRNFEKIYRLLIDIFFLFKNMEQFIGNADSNYEILNLLLDGKINEAVKSEVTISLILARIPLVVFSWPVPQGVSYNPMAAKSISPTLLSMTTGTTLTNQEYAAFPLADLYLRAEQGLVHYNRSLIALLSSAPFNMVVDTAEIVGAYAQSWERNLDPLYGLELISIETNPAIIKCKEKLKLYKQCFDLGDMTSGDAYVIYHLCKRYLCYLGTDAKNWIPAIRQKLWQEGHVPSTPTIIKILYDLYNLLKFGNELEPYLSYWLQLNKQSANDLISLSVVVELVYGLLMEFDLKKSFLSLPTLNSVIKKEDVEMEANGTLPSLITNSLFKVKKPEADVTMQPASAFSLSLTGVLV